MLLCVIAALARVQAWPSLATFAFEPSVSVAGAANPVEKLLPGLTTKLCGQTEGSFVVSDSDQLDSVGVALNPQGTGTKCWGDTRYASTAYAVEVGAVKSTAGVTYDAYRFAGPNSTASSFVASKTSLMMKAPAAGEYRLYRLESTGPSILGSLTATVADEWLRTAVFVSSIARGDRVVYFLLPLASRVSEWPLFGSTERARLFKGARFALSAERFDISASAATPFQASTGWSMGFDAHGHKYGTWKRFFRVHDASGGEGIVWQDPATNKIYLTWLPGDAAATSIELPTLAPLADSPYLMSATCDEGLAGHIVYLVMKRGGAADKVTPTELSAFKVAPDGSVVTSKALDTNSLNCYQFFAAGASLAWSVETNEIAFIISRTMKRGGDGLNHQGAIAVVLDGTTLDVIKNLGQTSGHSFANAISVARNKTRDMAKPGNGEFVGVDLGDNYPRGINVHRISRTGKSSKVVYEFKTQHGRTALSPAGQAYPEYPEISTATTTYYKWSNDNGVCVACFFQSVGDGTATWCCAALTLSPRCLPRSPPTHTQLHGDRALWRSRAQ